MEATHKHAIVFQTIYQKKISSKGLFTHPNAQKLSRGEAVDKLKEYLFDKQVRFDSIRVLDFRKVDEAKYENLATLIPAITVEYIQDVTRTKLG